MNLVKLLKINHFKNNNCFNSRVNLILKDLKINL